MMSISGKISRRDNELAFSIIYKKYTQRLYNYGMHCCHDHDLVMDCLQELFVSIWDKRKHLPTVHSVGSYLFKSFPAPVNEKIILEEKISPVD